MSSSTARTSRFRKTIVRTAALISFHLPFNASAFEIKIYSDNSITILPLAGSEEEHYPFTQSSPSRRVHRISLDNLLGYRTCSVSYRHAAPVRVRWVPPPEFSSYADSAYDVIISFVEPSAPTPSRPVIIEEPKGVSSRYLSQYERKITDDGKKSITSFFQTAFLAKHFAFALPEGHSRTKRMANSAVDHLVSANRIMENINLQPGQEFEEFIAQNVGNGKRATKTIDSLQEMNISFFRDIRIAGRNISSGNRTSCEAGVHILKELDTCRDALSQIQPNLVERIHRISTANSPAENFPPVRGTSESFNFAARIEEAEKICDTLPLTPPP